MATLDVLTLVEAKEAINAAATTEHDDELPQWITAVSLRLDKLVGPVVRRQVTDEKHDGGRPEVFLRRFPVYAVTSVVEYTGTTPVTLVEQTTAVQTVDGYVTEDFSADAAYLSNCLTRRRSGRDAAFAAGRRNVVVSYEAGRFASTSTVDERFKQAARTMLMYWWRSQQTSTAQSGDYDVPTINFPKFAIPNAVRELMGDDVQELPPEH